MNCSFLLFGAVIVVTDSLSSSSREPPGRLTGVGLFDDIDEDREAIFFSLRTDGWSLFGLEGVIDIVHQNYFFEA